MPASDPASPRASQLHVTMEPVPETERLDEFKSSPVPTLRLQSPASLSAPELDYTMRSKPPTIRRSTEPISPSSPSWAAPTSIPYRPRTASPLSSSGLHSRSKSITSGGGVAGAPGMARTQSMPGVSGSGHILYSPQQHHQMMARPESPSGSPSRASGSAASRLPRTPVDEAYPTSPTRRSVLVDGGPEGRILERRSSPNLGVVSIAAAPSSSSSRHRRPSSPLRWGSSGSLTNNGVPPPPTTPSGASSVASSPSLRGSSSSGYDSFPPPAPLSSSYYYSSASATFPGGSSVPSTPTSARSRSPSISSLETIPDSPDAEKAALEEERVEQQLRLAATAEEGADAKGKSASLDVPARGRTMGFGPRDKRKRWSVCGAERRGDLDLETIWED